MTGIQDADDQYGDDSKLKARINLHQRFSASPITWYRWVFDQMHLPSGIRVLELGAGTGLLWQENRDRLPPSIRIVVSDSSEGMLRTAKGVLAGMAEVEFRRFDAAEISQPDNSFDAVVANHMLYHVADRVAVLSEVVRVLRPNGRFYATTNGAAHMREVDGLIGPKATALQLSATRFGLENGRGQLTAFFDSVELLGHHNPLRVTDARAVVDDVESLSLGLPAGELTRIGQVVERAIARDGAFLITRHSGLFRCGGPHGERRVS